MINNKKHMVMLTPQFFGSRSERLKGPSFSNDFLFNFTGPRTTQSRLRKLWWSSFQPQMSYGLKKVGEKGAF